MRFWLHGGLLTQKSYTDHLLKTAADDSLPHRFSHRITNDATPLALSLKNITARKPRAGVRAIFTHLVFHCLCIPRLQGEETRDSSDRLQIAQKAITKRTAAIKFSGLTCPLPSRYGFCLPVWLGLLQNYQLLILHVPRGTDGRLPHLQSAFALCEGRIHGYITTDGFRCIITFCARYTLPFELWKNYATITTKKQVHRYWYSCSWLRLGSGQVVKT